MRHPASFRDPESGVVVHAGRVFRFFGGRGIADFEAVHGSGLLDALVRQGHLIEYERVSPGDHAALSAALPGDSLVVEHPRLPFISYVYEWPFGMLKAATLLYLEVLSAALEAGFILKDASTYNVQFVGPKPIVIDLGSFSPYEEGQPWHAYAQFCRMFLNPLLLASLVGMSYHGWLRSSLEGIAPADLSRLLGLRHKLRPSVATNVVLQALLQRRFGALTADDIGVKPYLPKKALLRQVHRLSETVRSLHLPAAQSAWTTYEATRSYSAAARAQKAAVVQRLLAGARPGLVWDLGSNAGEYALIASAYADTVVAMDADAAMAEQLYRRISNSRSNVLPLVMDLLNPSPDQGWGERERQGLLARGKADFVLSLALIHHICIGGNVPVRALVAWLARIARQGLLEFVPKSDPMVERLLGWREDIYSDYNQATLEAALLEHFALTEVCRLPDSERVLYAFAERCTP